MSYMQSKTFAEKAARDVASSLGVEIVTVHPSFVQATWLLFPHPRRRTYSACHGAGPDAAASRAGFRPTCSSSCSKARSPLYRLAA